MKEHKVGETFIFTDEHSHQHKLFTKDVTSSNSCAGCYFFERFVSCIDNFNKLGECLAYFRKDERNVIFKEVKE